MIWARPTFTGRVTKSGLPLQLHLVIHKHVNQNDVLLTNESQSKVTFITDLILMTRPVHTRENWWSRDGVSFFLPLFLSLTGRSSPPPPSFCLSLSYQVPQMVTPGAEIVARSHSDMRQEEEKSTSTALERLHKKGKKRKKEKIPMGIPKLNAAAAASKQQHRVYTEAVGSPMVMWNCFLFFYSLLSCTITGVLPSFLSPFFPLLSTCSSLQYDTCMKY